MKISAKIIKKLNTYKLNYKIMKKINLNADNVVLMLGKTNAFYIEIDGKYEPTKHNDVSQYHAMLWLKDIEYRTKTAQAILREWFYNSLS